MAFERPRLIHTLTGAQQYGSLQTADRIMVERPGDDLPGYADPTALTGITVTAKVRTPYDYGATPGNEMSEDNHPYVQLLFNAVAASYDAVSRSYGIVASFSGARFRCDDEVWVGGLRNPGATIIGEGGGIYSNATGKVAFNMALCNRVFINGFTVWGDQTNTPAYGIYFGRADDGAGNFPVSPGMKFAGCQTQGYFSHAGIWNFASETSSHVGCFYQNKSRSLTAVCYAHVGHRSAIDNNLGGTVTSANATFPTVASGAHSNLGHELIGCRIDRNADVTLNIVSIPRGATTTVTVESGTLAGANFSNGDKVRFPNVTGMTELKTGEYTIANLNTGADTFDISGLDSSGFGADGDGGSLRSATGPAMLLNGCLMFTADALYPVSYATANIVVDLSVGSALRQFNMRWQPENKSDCAIEFIVPSSPDTADCQAVNLECLNASQEYADAFFKVTGTGNLTIKGGRIEIVAIGNVPSGLLFDNPANVSLVGVDVQVAKEAILNAASAYTSYQVLETALDRIIRTKDYRIVSFDAMPEFRPPSIAQAGLTVVADDDSASAGPPVETYRESDSPAANDLLGEFWMSGDSDTGVKRVYARMRGRARDPANGAEKGQIDFIVLEGGASTTVVSIREEGVVVNGSYVQTNLQATTAELEDIADPVNTDSTYSWKQVINATTGKPVWKIATGAAAVWKDATGATVHTPV